MAEWRRDVVGLSLDRQPLLGTNAYLTTLDLASWTVEGLDGSAAALALDAIVRYRSGGKTAAALYIMKQRSAFLYQSAVTGCSVLAKNAMMETLFLEMAVLTGVK